MPDDVKKPLGFTRLLLLVCVLILGAGLLVVLVNLLWAAITGDKLIPNL